MVIFGTQEKDFAGITSKKKDFDTEPIFIFRFNDAGKVTDLKISWDHEGFVGQLTKWLVRYYPITYRLYRHACNKVTVGDGVFLF